MMTLKRYIGRYQGLAVAAALFLGACDTPEHSPTYQEAHPIQVIEEVVTLGISAPRANGDVVTGERNGFARFTRIYHTRSKGPITIYIDETKAGGIGRDDIIERVALGLKRAGVTPRHLQVMPGSLGHEGAAPVMLSFDAHQAIAPECGNWSEGTSFNWTNATHSNYGCAYQRNLALSVANPADFLENQPISTFDGVRGVVNVVTYQTGAFISSTSSEGTTE